MLKVLFWGAWRYKLLVFLGASVGAAIGVFLGVVTPNQYESVGKLYIKPGIRDALAPDAVIAGASQARLNVGLREAVQNEMQVLTANALFDKIVEHVGADVLLAPYDPQPKDGEAEPWHTALFHQFQSWWFASAALPETEMPATPHGLASMMLASSVRIVPEPFTSVISFAYTSHSPELARRVVNAALEAAKELHREVFETMTAVAAMEEEYKVAEVAARDVEKRLRELRVEKGIYDLESRQVVLVEYLNSIQQRLDGIDIDTRRLKAELAAVTKALEAEPRERHRMGSDTAVLNPAYTALVEQQSFLHQELLRLALESTERPTAIVEQRRKNTQEQLQAIRTQLEQVPMQVRIEGIKEENPDYVRLHQRLMDISIELEGLVAQGKELQVVRAENQKQLSELESLAPEVRALEDEVRQKRVKADRLAEGVANVRTVQRLDQINLGELKVMHAATLPTSKVAPQRSKMVLFGAFAGLAIGLALAGLLTLTDRRVQVAEDLIRLGISADSVLLESRSEPSAVAWSLPAALSDSRSDIASFWASLAYDRTSDHRFRIAVLSCGGAVDASRAAAVLGLGLAAHGGESVALVTTRSSGGWLAHRLALPTEPGWAEVVRGIRTPDQVELATIVPGLAFVPRGDEGESAQEPLSMPVFAALLETLAKRHRFVVIDLPDVLCEPATRAVLGLVDAVYLVAASCVSTKHDVQQAIKAVAAAGSRLLGAVARPSRSSNW